MARVDIATSRVAGTVTLLGTLITGFGIFTGGFAAATPAVEWLSAAVVSIGCLAVVCGLLSNVITVYRGLNTADFKQLQRWYTRRFRVRVPLVRTATLLLILAVLGAGATAAVVALSVSPSPSMSVTRTTQIEDTPSDTVTVDVAFRGLRPTESAILLIMVNDAVVARAAFMSGPDGIASKSLTIGKINVSAVVVVSARTAARWCESVLNPAATSTPVKCR